VGNLLLEVIHTPGHTPGSISIKCEDMVFTGDALFNEAVGRTDFPYGSQERSVKVHTREIISPAGFNKGLLRARSGYDDRL